MANNLWTRTSLASSTLPRSSTFTRKILFWFSQSMYTIDMKAIILQNISPPSQPCVYFGQTWNSAFWFIGFIFIEKRSFPSLLWTSWLFLIFHHHGYYNFHCYLLTKDLTTLRRLLFLEPSLYCVFLNFGCNVFFHHEWPSKKLATSSPPLWHCGILFSGKRVNILLFPSSRWWRPHIQR